MKIKIYVLRKNLFITTADVYEEQDLDANVMNDFDFVVGAPDDRRSSGHEEGESANDGCDLEANETKETHHENKLTKSSRLPDASLRIGGREGTLYRGTCG